MKAIKVSLLASVLALLSLTCTAMPSASQPYTLVKNPYSMSPTTSSVRILWQTADTVSMGQVRYGTSPDRLDQVVTSRSGWYIEGEGFVHIVELTGLQPFTRYYYAVGDGTR